MSTEGIAERIRARRKKLKWTQTKLADEIGSTQTTVSDWETGTVPEAASILKLCEVFDVSADWLLTGSGAMRRRAS